MLSLQNWPIASLPSPLFPFFTYIHTYYTFPTFFNLTLPFISNITFHSIPLYYITFHYITLYHCPSYNIHHPPTHFTNRPIVSLRSTLALPWLQPYPHIHPPPIHPSFNPSCALFSFFLITHHVLSHLILSFTLSFIYIQSHLIKTHLEIDQ